jgi:hypothetical protein
MVYADRSVIALYIDKATDTAHARAFRFGPAPSSTQPRSGESQLVAIYSVSGSGIYPARDTAAGHERPETAGTGIFINSFSTPGARRGSGQLTHKTKD